MPRVVLIRSSFLPEYLTPPEVQSSSSTVNLEVLLVLVSCLHISVEVGLPSSLFLVPLFLYNHRLTPYSYYYEPLFLNLRRDVYGLYSPKPWDFSSTTLDQFSSLWITPYCDPFLFTSLVLTLPLRKSMTTTKLFQIVGFYLEVSLMLIWLQHIFTHLGT